MINKSSPPFKKLFLAAALAALAALCLWPRDAVGAPCSVYVERCPGGCTGDVTVDREGTGCVVIRDCLLPVDDSYTTVRAEAALSDGHLRVVSRHDWAGSELYTTGNHVLIYVELPEGAYASDISRVSVEVKDQNSEKHSFQWDF